MDFAHTERTRHPRERMFLAHRDELEAVVRHLDAVRAVELRERTQHADGRVELMHRWLGTHAALPLIVRPMVREHQLVWHHRTLWDGGSWCAEWRIEVPSLGQALMCTGRNEYLDDGRGSRVDVRGALSIDPAKLGANVPPSAVPIIERVVVSMIVPLIQQSGAAAARHLDAMARAR